MSLTQKQAQQFVDQSAVDSTAYTTGQISETEWKSRVAARDAQWKTFSAEDRELIRTTEPATQPR